MREGPGESGDSRTNRSAWSLTLSRPINSDLCARVAPPWWANVELVTSGQWAAIWSRDWLFGGKWMLVAVSYSPGTGTSE